MTDGPKRYESDPYMPLPAAVLEQMRESGAPPPELVEAMHEAQEGPHSQDITQVPCGLCLHCPGCDGSHMVSPAARAEQDRLAKTDPENPAP